VEAQLLTEPTVVIGHSMGGCISRLLLTDSGNKLWMNIFGCSPDDVPLSPQVREYFREELSFDTGDQMVARRNELPLPMANSKAYTKRFSAE